MDSVALVRYCGDIEETLRKAVSLIGGFGELRSPIIVKPNICTDHDPTGHANTNVMTVEALVKIL